MEPCYMWLEFGHINQTSGLFSWFLNDSKNEKLLILWGHPFNLKKNLNLILVLSCRKQSSVWGRIKRIWRRNPCSNFRKKELQLNENLIKNYFSLFEIIRNQQVNLFSLPPFQGLFVHIHGQNITMEQLQGEIKCIVVEHKTLMIQSSYHGFLVVMKLKKILPIRAYENFWNQ